MIKAFLKARGIIIAKQIFINILSIYFCGFMIGQIIYTIAHRQTIKHLEIMDSGTAILGFKLLSIAAIGLILQIIWKEMDEYKISLKRNDSTQK